MKNFSLAVHHKTFLEHKKSIKTRISQGYISRKITLKEHADFVLQQYHVFKKLELVLDAISKNQSFFSNNFSKSLERIYRSESLLNDYNYACKLLGKNPSVSNIWPETQNILDTLQVAENEEKYDEILAHAFVNYLAVLNGGTSVLKEAITGILKNHGGKDVKNGVTFYAFHDQNGTEIFPDKIRVEIEKEINHAVNNSTITIENFTPLVKKTYEMAIEQLEHKTNVCNLVLSTAQSFFSNKNKLMIAAVTSAIVTTAAITFRN